MDTPPQMMIAQGEVYQRRLRVQLSQAQDKALFVNDMHHAPTAKVSVPTAKVSVPTAKVSVPSAKVSVPSVKASTPSAQDTIAVPHPEYPDTYDIFIKGVKKGYAAVQDIDLSRRLKKACETQGINEGLCVNVEWNEEFSSYEIVGF